MNHLLNIAGQQNQQQLHNEIQVIEVCITFLQNQRNAGNLPASIKEVFSPGSCARTQSSYLDTPTHENCLENPLAHLTTFCLILVKIRGVIRAHYENTHLDFNILAHYKYCSNIWNIDNILYTAYIKSLFRQCCLQTGSWYSSSSNIIGLQFAEEPSCDWEEPKGLCLAWLLGRRHTSLPLPWSRTATVSVSLYRSDTTSLRPNLRGDMETKALHKGSWGNAVICLLINRMC